MTAVTTAEDRDLIRTARVTGAGYLGLALCGLFGFLLIRPVLFDPDDAAATLANLVEHQTLARLGIAFELGIVITQLLAALWFQRLFRPVDPFAAGAIAVFGAMNAVAVLVSAACLATALQVALAPVGDAGLPQLLYLVSENLWGVGAVFFGLWLLPMGRCVLRSGWMPQPLGWLLVAGGIGYLLSAFVRYLVPGSGIAVSLLTLPASVGEFWMIGYLLVRGVRPGRDRSAATGGPQDGRGRPA
jgi:hypothetical protein